MKIQNLFCVSFFLSALSAPLYSDARGALARAEYEIASLNQQVETLEKKISIQDTTIETLRSYLYQEQEKTRNLVTKRLSELEQKLSSFPKVDVNAKIQDLNQAHNQTLKTYQERIYTLEKEIESQQLALKQMRNSLGSVLDYLKSNTTSAVAENEGKKGQSYRVQSGDSLSEIAKKFGVSIEAIKKKNNKSSDRIIIGEELLLP